MSSGLRRASALRSPAPLILKGWKPGFKGTPLGSAPVCSELQVRGGGRSSVASVILENLRLYGLTPGGAFFLLLPSLPGPGCIPGGDGSMPLGCSLSLPFPQGSPLAGACHPVTPLSAFRPPPAGLPVTLREAGVIHLLQEPCHPPSSDPEGGSGRPLPSGSRVEASSGELESAVSASQGGCLWPGSLRCSCGVLLVKQTPLSALRVQAQVAWEGRFHHWLVWRGVCVCTRARLMGLLSPRSSTGSPGRPREQPPQQQQQQSGLAAGSPEEGRASSPPSAACSARGEGPARTPGKEALGRWVLHHGGGLQRVLPRGPRPGPVRASVTHAGASSWEQERRSCLSSWWVWPPPSFRVSQRRSLPSWSSFSVFISQKVQAHRSPPADHRNTCLGHADFLLMSRPFCFFIAGISRDKLISGCPRTQQIGRDKLKKSGSFRKSKLLFLVDLTEQFPVAPHFELFTDERGILLWVCIIFWAAEPKAFLKLHFLEDLEHLGFGRTRTRASGGCHDGDGSWVPPEILAPHK